MEIRGYALLSELEPNRSTIDVARLDRFPFHTDLAHWRVPPRYLVLRCQVGYLDVPTLMLTGGCLPTLSTPMF